METYPAVNFYEDQYNQFIQATYPPQVDTQVTAEPAQDQIDSTTQVVEEEEQAEETPEAAQEEEEEEEEEANENIDFDEMNWI